MFHYPGRFIMSEPGLRCKLLKQRSSTIHEHSVILQSSTALRVSNHISCLKGTVLLKPAIEKLRSLFCSDASRSLDPALLHSLGNTLSLCRIATPHYPSHGDADGAFALWLSYFKPVAGSAYLLVQHRQLRTPDRKTGAAALLALQTSRSHQPEKLFGVAGVVSVLERFSRHHAVHEAFADQFVAGLLCFRDGDLGLTGGIPFSRVEIARPCPRRIKS